ncbi:unnamed protein product [Kluyveromyces dobzhanskii CBS 2104]|uniref:Ubiquitin carboxyl-terminal hydrolase n=1 Tax=Kluyveromyces dobzhanskii CBS 2104 TaxID=1427455 RepID=A0A0A8L945_9SACH|nr:unnamed protein product [Kluyveromyces dobzhanskii CBS 2104]
MSGWNTIESDAGVFTRLITDLGVEGLQFEDIPYLEYLEEGQISSLLKGVVFLFPYKASIYRGSEPIQGKYETDSTKLFFSQQTIQNACATQAVINMLFNLAQDAQESVSLGPEMTTLYEFVKEFHQPDLIGETIGNSELIRNVHNSFSPPNLFVSDEDDPYRNKGKKEEVFHFVGFIPHNSRIYELDGLRPYPIDHGPFTDFSKDLKDILQTRMNLLVEQCVQKFNLIGVIKDKLEFLQDQLQKEGITDSEEFIFAEQLQEELNKREQWNEEITCRKHNFTGLALELMKQITSSMSQQEFQEALTLASNK